MFEGIPLPELVLRDLAQQAVDSLLSDRTVISWCMATRPGHERDSLYTALANKPGKVRLGFSLEQAEDWQVVILLAGTSAPQRTIGDIVGVLEEEPLASGTISEAIPATGDFALTLGSPPPGIPLRGRLRIGPSASLPFQPSELAVYAITGEILTLLSRGLQGTVAASWPAGTPITFHSLTPRVGWGELCDLRVDVLSSNTYLNLVLASVIKSAFLLAMASGQFEAAGMTLRSITESEMAPRPQLWPAELYNRTLLLQIARDYAIPETLPVLTEIDVVLHSTYEREAPHGEPYPLDG